jgi:hypothetical protein
MVHMEVIEHGSTPRSRWLHARRSKIALGVALVEGVLVLAHVILAWVAIVAGVAIVGYWVFAGRHHKSQLARDASWAAALSQVVMALVPLLAFVLTTLAIVVLVAIAVIALVALVADRR